jgi:hypothetical protein
MSQVPEITRIQRTDISMPALTVIKFQNTPKLPGVTEENRGGVVGAKEYGYAYLSGLQYGAMQLLVARLPDPLSQAKLVRGLSLEAAGATSEYDRASAVIANIRMDVLPKLNAKVSDGTTGFFIPHGSSSGHKLDYGPVNTSTLSPLPKQDIDGGLVLDDFGGRTGGVLVGEADGAWYLRPHELRFLQHLAERMGENISGSELRSITKAPDSLSLDEVVESVGSILDEISEGRGLPTDKGYFLEETRDPHDNKLTGVAFVYEE